MPRRPPENPIGDLITQQAAAEHYGVHRRTINEWRKKGCPKNDDGTYSTADVDAWRAQQTGAGKIPDAEVKDDTLLARKVKAEVRNAEARAQKTQLQADQLAGKLIPLDAHRAALEERAVFFRRKLQSIARKMGTRLANVGDAGEAEKMLRESFDALLWEAYEKGERPA